MVGDVPLAVRETSERRATIRKIAIAAGLILLVLGVLDFARTGRGDVATKAWALDYDINLIAAQRLVNHEDIYSRSGSVKTGRELVAPYMRHAYQDEFTSYIGTPPVALTHVPFLALDHDTGTRLFRILSLVEMIGAIVIAAWALSPAARLPAALFGCAALFWGFPMVKSVAMGQANGLVMLCFAVAIWAASRERWGLVGVAIGVAAVLKVSPVLLLVYLLIRGRIRPLWTATLTAVGFVAAAAVVGRPGQIFDWTFDIAPRISKGTLSAYNQSIAGAMARLTTSFTDLSARTGPGAWYLLAYAVWILALVGLWRMRRNRPFDVLELGLVVLVVLLAGPLTWDHYLVWALIPGVLACDITRWERLRLGDAVAVTAGLGFAVWLLYHGISIPSPHALADSWFPRLATVRYTFAMITALAALWWLLHRAPIEARTTAEWPDDTGGTTVGAAREVVAAGIH
jgi:alpha-1,2-mannosyltransferase